MQVLSDWAGSRHQTSPNVVLPPKPSKIIFKSIQLGGNLATLTPVCFALVTRQPIAILIVKIKKVLVK